VENQLPKFQQIGMAAAIPAIPLPAPLSTSVSNFTTIAQGTAQLPVLMVQQLFSAGPGENEL